MSAATSSSSARDAVHPAAAAKRRRRSSGGGSCSKGAAVAEFCRDFGPYQVCLLAATQLSYIPIAASILSTSFMKMSKESCEAVLAARNDTAASGNGSSPAEASADWLPPGEFRSLLTLWRLECDERAQTIQTAISTMIMLGGLVGAFVSGFLADRSGRRPVVIASMALTALANALLLAAPALTWPATLPVFFLLGGACGGYMTTNLVLVVESLTLPASRLLVVALNGWSLSMAATAGLAWACPDWFQYHLATAVLGAVASLALFGVADESLRWLRSRQHGERFERASARLVRFNRGAGHADVPLLCQLEKDAAAQRRPLVQRGEEGESGRGGGRGGGEEGRSPVPLHPTASLTYVDLFAERSLRPRLLALAYCFFCSSIVSFGFYFAFDSLSGDRYANLALGGGGKFLLGLLPFLVSSCVSRKQVALISVAAAAAAAWVVLGCLIAGLPFQSTTVTVLSLVATASLDPTWKISHLYSTELFPTPMRNMARGICNSAARVGSVLAPLVSHLRHELPHLSYGMFAALLTAQFVITALFLPDQPPSELLDSIPAAVAAAADDEAAAAAAAAAESAERRRRKARRSDYDEEEEEEDETRSRETSSQASETAPLTP